jgi:hypothetical protein
MTSSATADVALGDRFGFNGDSCAGGWSGRLIPPASGSFNSQGVLACGDDAKFGRMQHPDRPSMTQ